MAGVCTGFSAAILLLAWAEVYGRMEPGRVFVYGALSLAFGALAYLFITQSSLITRQFATFCIPAASFLMCTMSYKYVGIENTAAGTQVPPSIALQPQTRYSFPWKPVLMMGVCGFSAAFVDVALFSQGTLPHILADLIVGVLLIGLVFISKQGVKPVVLVGLSLGCMVLGIASVALFGAQAAFAASLLTMLSYVIITFFTYALLANKSFRHGIPTLWLFGFAAAARIAFDHLGGFARMAFPHLNGLSSSQLDLAVMAVIGLVVIGVIALMWMSERSFNSSWAIERIDTGASAPARSEREIILLGCERRAEAAGLTERETEILGMLIEGQTYQQMCSNLLLSPNTIKTHTRHVYGKLGVHTREEAVALIKSSGEKP